MFDPMSAAAKTRVTEESVLAGGGSSFAIESSHPSRPMHYPRLDKAMRLAAKLHSGQEREGESPLPYLTHPVEVLVYLRHLGDETDEDLLCAAVLHDVVEESNSKITDLAKEVGEQAAALVRELTRREPREEERRGLDKDALWRLRATMLLDEIRAMSPEAQKIKLADRLANVRDGKRTKAGAKWERYAWQSEEILKIVPKERSPGLWSAIREELDGGPDSLTQVDD